MAEGLRQARHDEESFEHVGIATRIVNGIMAVRLVANPTVGHAPCSPILMVVARKYACHGVNIRSAAAEDHLAMGWPGEHA